MAVIHVRQLTVMRIVLLTMILFCINIIAGCDSSAESKNNTSVKNFLTAMKNFEELDVIKCNYDARKTESFSLVPSPSNTKIKLIGTAELSSEGSQLLKTKYEWQSIQRDRIPLSLLSILPPGDIQVSLQFNESFNGNPYFWYGYAITIVDDHWKKIYFLIHDQDHPIEDYKEEWAK